MKVLIIEDEQLASDKLESLLRKMNQGIEVIGKLRTVKQTVEFLTEMDHPELIISDIKLLDGISFEVFSQVEYKNPIIFTTAYDQYAIKAFEVNSIDYLLKPIQSDKLALAFEKLAAFRNSEVNDSLNVPDYSKILELVKSGNKEYKSRFMIKVGQKITAVPTEQISFFYSQNKLTYLVTKEGRKYPMDQTLETIDPLLDPKRFTRANRQYIVSFESIHEIHPYFKGRVKLELKPNAEHEIIISSDKTPSFKKWLDQ